MKGQEWIDAAAELPPLDKYVLGYVPNMPWMSYDNPKRKVVMRVAVWRSLDGKSESGPGTNNRGLDYYYKEFGPNSFFGFEITHWMPLPDPPVDDPGCIQERTRPGGMISTEIPYY